ncbi:MAG: hypothetical protein WBV31_10435 [Terriglobales bacterium]
MSSKRVLGLQSQKIAAIAQENFRFERQLAKQCGTEFCPGSRFTHNKGTRSTHVPDLVGAQFLGEDAGAKGSVSADIDTPKEDDKNHSPDYEEKEQGAPGMSSKDELRRWVQHRAGVTGRGWWGLFCFGRIERVAPSFNG